jgi:quercetin dioxygenase-like cupin family protein
VVDSSQIDWDAIPETSPYEGVRGKRIDTDRLTIVRYSLEPGGAYPLHSHPEEQLVHGVSGQIDFTVAGETVRIRPGDSYYVAGGVEHGARCAGPDTAHFLNIVAPRRA